MRFTFTRLLRWFHIWHASGMKVYEASESFFFWAENERQYAKQSVAKHRDCFAAWILPRIGSVELEQLEWRDVMELRQAMLRRKLSVARQSSVLSTLKVFLGFCRTTLHIDAMNPAEVTIPKKPRPNPEALDEEERQRMWQAININQMTGVRLRALTGLLSQTGMRIGETLALDRQQFDMGEKDTDTTGKGGKRRTIFITPRALFWVRQYLARRTDQATALFVTTGSSPRRWAQTDVSKCFIQLRRAAKISKKLTPHMLRHTFCTDLRNNGADISLIQGLAGHADIDTTARYYLKTDKAVLRTAVKKYLNQDTKDVHNRAA